MSYSVCSVLCNHMFYPIPHARAVHSHVYRILFRTNTPRFSSAAINYKGAVQVDVNERIFAHPNHATNLQDHRAFEVTTAYDVLQRSIQLYGNRKLFSFRNSSQDAFQSYSYKYDNKRYFYS
jgi:hypothetical protein